MGGYLTTSMYCLPLLKTDLVYPGFIQSNILANSERFTEGVSRAFAEYTCLSRAFAEKVLGITLVGREPFADVSPGTVITTDNEHPNAPRWLETSMVYRWGLSRCSELPEKAMFTRWMMQVFYKLSLPPPADIRMSSGRLAQPLTMLTFLKLCGFLVHTRGIPSHWVGGFIDSILSGFIISTARPPSTSPLVLYEVVAAKSNKSARKFCTEAFVVELRSLLIRHRHALSLRFCTPLFGNVAIYALKFVVKVSKDHRDRKSVV